MNSFASQAEVTHANQTTNQQDNKRDQFQEKPEKIRKPLSSKQVLHRVLGLIALVVFLCITSKIL